MSPLKIEHIDTDVIKHGQHILFISLIISLVVKIVSFIWGILFVLGFVNTVYVVFVGQLLLNTGVMNSTGNNTRYLFINDYITKIRETLTYYNVPLNVYNVCIKIYDVCTKVYPVLSDTNTRLGNNKYSKEMFATIKHMPLKMMLPMNEHNMNKLDNIIFTGGEDLDNLSLDDSDDADDSKELTSRNNVKVHNVSAKRQKMLERRAKRNEKMENATTRDNVRGMLDAISEQSHNPELIQQIARSMGNNKKPTPEEMNDMMAKLISSIPTDM
jgi:hypothetical protein